MTGSPFQFVFFPLARPPGVGADGSFPNSLLTSSFVANNGQAQDIGALEFLAELSKNPISSLRRSNDTIKFIIKDYRQFN